MVMLLRCIVPTAVRSVTRARFLQSAAYKGPAFAFDIDGVLKQGEHVLPQAKEALQILTGSNPEGKHYPFIFVTNGGGYIEADRAQRLTAELGVPIAEHQIVQSHSIFQTLALKYGNKPVLILGGRGDACRKVAEYYGFNAYIPTDILAWSPELWPFHRLTEEELSYAKVADFATTEFAAVLCFHDSEDWGLDTQMTIDLLLSSRGIIGTSKDRSNPALWTKEAQLPVYFSNPDLLWSNRSSQPRFGQGALQEAVAGIYKATTGYDLHRTVGGKPSNETYTYASALLNSAISAKATGLPVDKSGSPSSHSHAGKVYMVGDNPKSDIAGANAFKWESILVRTGVFRGKYNDEEHPATVVVPDVLEAVKWALKREGERLFSTGHPEPH